MGILSIKITGNFEPKKISSKMKGALNIALHSSALIVQNKAKRLAPHDIGTLRRSVTNLVTNSSHAEVGTDLDYAAIHEFGGRAGRNRASKIRPYKGVGYLRPALQRSEPKIKKIFKKAVEQSIT